MCRYRAPARALGPRVGGERTHLAQLITIFNSRHPFLYSIQCNADTKAHESILTPRIKPRVIFYAPRGGRRTEGEGRNRMGPNCYRGEILAAAIHLNTARGLGPDFYDRKRSR